MSDLAEVLDGHAEAIRDALAEKLAQADCPTLARVGALGAGRLLAVFREVCQTEDDAPAQAWAAAVCREGLQLGLPWTEVMTGLHCLQRAVRFQVIKCLDQKRMLLGALTEMGAAIERLRRAYLAAIHSDAGRQPQVEEALAECEARKHAILESALDPIITINHEGVITEFNRAAEQTFGHPREKVLGTQPSEVLFPAAAGHADQDRITRYLESGEGSMLGRRTEVTAVRANGETFPAEIAMTISREHGAAVMSFFVRDISQQKKAEEERARYAGELERSNQELEQFAYIASHDLQEPLRKIRTFSDRLEMKCKDQLDETGQECVERMQSAAARMQLLIDGLLSLSRVTTKVQQFVPVELAKVVQEVVSDLEVQIEQVGGRVEVGKLPTIQADALQMRQLLQNLIGNGLKFRRLDEPPVVKVLGRLLHGREQRAGRHPAAQQQCCLVVEDNGIGFEEKHQERIFGIFQRLHPRDVYEGTGIGLAICRRIVERHGGSISARSIPGSGSTFEIILPIMQPKKRAEGGGRKVEG